MIIHIYEYPENCGQRFYGVVYPCRGYSYQPHPDSHPWFEHHERGSNRTVHLNRAPTMDY